MATKTTTIEVDAAAAEIIRRADARARANGETLGAYLQHNLPPEIVNGNGQKQATQAKAWDKFVAGMTSLVEASVPSGHLADDSRDSMYDDRN